MKRYPNNPAYELFRIWLSKSKGYSPKGAGDACSRCRRVEALLGIELSHELRSEKGAERVVSHLREKLSTKPNTPERAGVATLTTAIRAYRQFTATRA